jgi:thiol-disulfide isomerase/thioredoxin
MNRCFILPGVLFVLLTALLLASCRSNTSGAGASDPLVGTVAPVFSAPVLDAEGAFSLSDLRGKVVLIDFWAIFCGPCRESMPHLQEFFQRYSPDRLAIISVNLDPNSGDRRDRVRDYLRRGGFTFPVVIDNGRIAGLYGAARIPRLVLVDAAGQVARVFQGRTDPGVIADAIDLLLNDPAPQP